MENSDYHKIMNADMFMLWLERCLVPTFQELYPGKQMIPILDYAAYHHRMEEGWKSPLQVIKTHRADVLRQLGVASISVPVVDSLMKAYAVRDDGKWVCSRMAPTVNVQQATFHQLKRLQSEDLQSGLKRFSPRAIWGILSSSPPPIPLSSPSSSSGHTARTTWRLCSGRSAPSKRCGDSFARGGKGETNRTWEGFGRFHRLQKSSGTQLEGD